MRRRRPSPDTRPKWDDLLGPYDSSTHFMQSEAEYRLTLDEIPKWDEDPAYNWAQEVKEKKSDNSGRAS